MPIKIILEREQYQWNSDQRVIVTGIEDELARWQIHYATADMVEALVVLPARGEDGLVSAAIPNLLLQSTRSIIAYAYNREESKAYTQTAIAIRILPRPRPQDYVYTETEVLSYATLDKRMTELEDSIGETVASEVERYLEANPPDIAEQVQPDWNQSDSSAPDYIKNRTHYVELNESKIEVIPEQTFTAGSVLWMISGSIMEYLEHTISLTINNVEYTATIVRNPSTGGDFGATFEDGYYIYGTYSIEYAREYLELYGLTANTQYTIRGEVSASEERVVKIPEKYLPDPTQSDWQQTSTAAPDYIKNRTHYYSPLFYLERNTVTIADHDGEYYATTSANKKPDSTKSHYFEVTIYGEYGEEKYIYNLPVGGNSIGVKVTSGEKTYGNPFYMAWETDYRVKVSCPTLGALDFKVMRMNIHKLDAMYLPADIPGTLPAVSAADEGKILRVVGGAWAADELPSGDEVSY